MQPFRRTFWTPPRILVASFLAAGLLGAAGFLLPLMQADGATALAPVDSLFMAASAVCVTGLIVVDPATQFTFAGEAFLLLLIQIGGLGVITFSNLFILAVRKRIGVRERILVEHTHGELPTITSGALLRRVALYAFFFEALGALFLAPRFMLDYGFAHGLWLGVFHSVSAFCNAGFSLFADSLAGYRDDFYVNAVFMALIVAGGLGFVVFADLRGLLARRIWRLSLHSRVVLATTAILIAGGALSLWIFNLSRGGDPVAGLLPALFQSVTARTAGFNTVDVGALSNAALLLLVMLMMIGGSPGSAAGGFKTTTLAALFAMGLARLRNRPRAELFGRSLTSEATAKAVAAALLYLTATVFALLVLEWTEQRGAGGLQRGAFIEHLFEVVSALGTVGLSTGGTAGLTGLGKIVIILCMFFGRLGPLLVAASFIGRRRRLGFTYPEERLMIG